MLAPDCEIGKCYSIFGYAGNDGDVLTLNHDMSGAANDPHYTFTTSPAHQLASVTNTDADYVWSPAASGTDAYGAANTLNQYPTVTPSGASTKTLSYDAKGNLIGGNIASNGNWTFGYDAENRMLTAFRNNGAVQATYAYDPLGRRTRKSGVGVTETFFLCDGTDEIAEYSQAGTMTQRYVPGPAIDQPVARVTVAGGAKEYFHTNRQGSVIAMSDGTGAKVEGPFVYDSYGNGAPATGEPYKFTGRRLDAETGLYFYRARYYWPQGGRFMQTDPVGFDADINLYAYVGNDPTDKSDPEGNCPWCVVGAIVGAALDVGVQMTLEHRDIRHLDLKSVAISAAAGALGGGIATSAARLAGVGARIAINTLAGTAIGASASAVSDVAHDRPVSGTGMAKGALVGGVLGLAGAGAGEAIAGAGSAPKVSLGEENIMVGVAKTTASTGLRQSAPVKATQILSNSVSAIVSNVPSQVVSPAACNGNKGCPH